MTSSRPRRTVLCTGDVVENVIPSTQNGRWSVGAIVERRHAFALPGLGYWLALTGGLGVALLVVLATLPLLDRLTTLDTARFE